MQKSKIKNPRRKMTAREREDARDLAIIRKASRRPTYSWNDLMREFGYYDLVTPRKPRS